MSVSPEASILTAIDQGLAGIAIILLGVMVWASRNSDTAEPLRSPSVRNLHEEVLLIVIFVYMVSYLLLAGMVSLFLPDPEDVNGKLLASTGTQIVGIISCLVVGQRCVTGGWRTFLRGDRGKGSFGIRRIFVAALIALGLCPMIALGTMNVILMIWPTYEFAAHPTIDALHDPARSWLAIVGFWIGAVILAPVAEELFFRGLLQSFLASRLPSRGIAIVAASLAFGLVHATQIHAVGALTCLGVILGLVYEKSGSLVPAILIHAIFNMRTLVWNAISNSAGN